MDINDDCICPVCDKSFHTPKARNTHLSTATNCSWYRHGKLRVLCTEPGAPRRDDFHIYDLGQGLAGTQLNNLPSTDLSPEEAVDEMESVPHPGDYEDLFHFIDRDLTSNPDIGEPGPGPSTAAHWNHIANPRLLDDEGDPQVELVHPTARKVIRMDDTLHQVWR